MILLPGFTLDAMQLRIFFCCLLLSLLIGRPPQTLAQPGALRERLEAAKARLPVGAPPVAAQPAAPAEAPADAAEPAAELDPETAAAYAEIDSLGFAEDRKSSVAKLLGLCKSEDPQQRWRAARALGNCCTAEGAATPEMVGAMTALCADTDPIVQTQAAITLGRCGDRSPTVVGALTKLVASNDERVARSAISALRNLKVDPNVLAGAMNSVLQSDNQAVMSFAIEALVEAGPRATPLLNAALRRERSAYWACVAIADIGPDAAGTVGPLIEIVRSSTDLMTVKQAMVALAEVGPAASAAASTIETRARAERSPPVQIAAAFALGSIGNPSHDVWLKEVSGDRRPMLSMVAKWALARLHPEDSQAMATAVQALAPQLANPVREVRMAAAEGLKKLSPPPEMVANAILERLEAGPPRPPRLPRNPLRRPPLPGAQDPGAAADAGPPSDLGPEGSAEVQALIADALASLGPGVVPAATKALNNEKFRDLAVEVLGRVGPEAASAAPQLQPLVAGKDPKQVARIQFALAAMGPQASVATPQISANLKSPDNSVRQSALFALRQFGPAAAAASPDLVAVLASKDEFERLAAAWALARISPGDKAILAQVRPVLMEGLASKDEPSRIESILAVEELGPAEEDLMAKIAELAETDPSEEVRAIAAGSKPAAQP